MFLNQTPLDIAMHIKSVAIEVPSVRTPVVGMLAVQDADVDTIHT